MATAIPIPATISNTMMHIKIATTPPALSPPDGCKGSVGSNVELDAVPSIEEVVVRGNSGSDGCKGSVGSNVDAVPSVLGEEVVV